MEITRDALLRVVKATRLSMRLAQDISKLFMDKAPWSVADEIYGRLEEALFMISGEKLGSGKSIDDSMAKRLLTGDLDDGTVADWFIMMDKIDKRIRGITPVDVKIPEPQIMNPEKTKKLYEKNGGYRATPEGEWK